MNFNPIFAAGNRVEKASARKRQPCWKTQVNHHSKYIMSVGCKLLWINCKINCAPSVLAEAMQAEEISLPESLEDMQLMLLTLREDLITAKVAVENLMKELIFESRLVEREQMRD